MNRPVAGCPFHAATLPVDGTPLRPSPLLAEWREAGGAVPLRYDDGHQGLVATRYEVAKAVLQDPRFSMRPYRTPVGGELPSGVADDLAAPGELPGDLDDAASRSELSNLLVRDGAEHARLRRLITPRLSVKQVRGRQPWVSQMVGEQLAAFHAKGSPGDVWMDYARPIAARAHCRVIGIPMSDFDEFESLFVGPSTAQQKYDFIRGVLGTRASDPGDDIISDLLASEDVTREEVEGLLRMLMGAGRDSVAYLIATATVALLTHPEQLAALRDEPETIDVAIEEFMRTGAMFLTVFPRTATEDVELEGVSIKAGQSVSVSPVGANRDPRRWERAEEFDVSRDAYGHLGFGHGIHGCVGQQLARLEIREAITQLIAGCPQLRLISADQLEPMPFAHPVATYEAGSVIVEWSRPR